ncbi:MATE family efflux transporter [Clostridium ihumii]|uniref:MATE family efflux transporter n=1 Tax=Clostridium ihumii TaxID=1470356 RepID=UPI003D343A4A
MNRKVDLTNDKILKSLITLALPIMGTSFIQMAYNLTDMLWIGRMGSLAVAAVGTASFFNWLGQSLMMLSKSGAEICVSQSYGRKDLTDAKLYAKSAIQFGIILSLVYTLVLVIFKEQFIGFFKLNSPEVVTMAETYLLVISLGMVFNFINPILTGLFNGLGDSKIPFRINTVGLIFNMIFDPILIFGFGPIPSLGVLGAALATISAQLVVTILFLIHIKKQNLHLFEFNIISKIETSHINKIVKLSFPVALQNGLFCSFSMMIGRIIAFHGDTAIAVQKVGSQIEAISWMTAGGFSTAISAFIGQNYGAKKYNRIISGYKIALSVVSIIGIFATLLLVLGATPLFKIFINEPEALNLGVTYLEILGISQLFMCIEITTSGAFNGLGRTTLPAIISIVLTGLRVPFSAILSKPSILGLNGVWWTITISSILKGIILLILFITLIIKNKKFKESFELV